MNLSKFMSRTRDKLILHARYIEAAHVMTTSIAQFAIWKTPYSLLEGAANVVKTLFAGKLYSSDIFTAKDGWFPLFEETNVIDNIFIDVLKQYPNDILPIQGTYSNETLRIVKTPVGSVGLMESNYKGDNRIFYKPEEMNKDELLFILVREKKKSFKSNYFVLDVQQYSERDTSVSIYSEQANVIPSVKATEYSDYIDRSLKQDINRSIIMRGPPGTGKTTLANTIVSNLGMTTLKVQDDLSDDINWPTISSIISLFDIKAVIINDFDQFEKTNTMLEFIEKLNTSVKLVIATVNSLHNFEPAVIRPGRFDEIITVDKLDLDIVKKLCGELFDEFGERVKEWPVAYINELVKRSKLLPREKLNEVYEELNQRVIDQLMDLSDEEEQEEDLSDEEQEDE